MQDTPKFLSTHALGVLIHQILGLPEAARFDVLASACVTLGGTITQPGSASHLHEISVLGVYAGAPDRHELVLNWLCGARALHGAIADSADAGDYLPPPVAIDYHPTKRRIQLSEAAAKIARPDRHDNTDLISACQIILAMSHDHSERERAFQLAAALAQGTRGRRSE